MKRVIARPDLPILLVELERLIPGMNRDGKRPIEIKIKLKNSNIWRIHVFCLYYLFLYIFLNVNLWRWMKMIFINEYEIRSQFGGRSSGWSLATTSQLNTSLASNIQKMFNEKIEIFSPVEFSRISILTGIVKIALKTLLECVRLRTFSRFGFQQMQVDTHYLSLFLWRFVSDEHLVIFLCFVGPFENVN